MCWNVRGINSSWKWGAVKNKITSANCDVVCLQETKREEFDLQFLKNICPNTIDAFEFLPSVGASGGILIAWKSSMFSGNKIFSNEFGVSIQFCSLFDNATWILTCVYGPCTTEGKTQFAHWFRNIQMPASEDWIVMGDFNLIRSLEDRNKPGGDISEIMMFNAAISHLGIQEIPLQGRKFTWSNMQPSPLLEKLDWVFSSASWTLSYPNTSVRALDMAPSDHTPLVVNISTTIPKAKIFRFENYWMINEQFTSILNSAWSAPVYHTDRAKIITAKFKILRKKLREWQSI